MNCASLPQIVETCRVSRAISFQSSFGRNKIDRYRVFARRQGEKLGSIALELGDCPLLRNLDSTTARLMGVAGGQSARMIYRCMQITFAVVTFSWQKDFR